MKVLITGGAGFIGANLVRTLIADHEVVIVDDLSRGFANYLPENVPLIRQDVRAGQGIVNAMRDVDCVVHLAAYGSVVDSVADPLPNFEINAGGTLAVLEAARVANVKKFVFASTGGAIMGNTEPPVSELSLPKPISPYGASKLCGEAYCHAYAKSFGLSTVCLRFANVYGPYSAHKKGVITNYIKSIKRGDPLVIFGDGKSSRDYLHVTDLCAGIASAIKTPLEGGDIFHLASGREISLLDLLGHFRDIAGDADYPCDFFPARTGEVDRNCADAAKAQEVLNFKPSVDFAAGLRETFDWFAQFAPES